MISPRIAQRVVPVTLRKSVAADVSGPIQRFVSYFRGQRHTIERLTIPNGPNLSLTGVREPHIHVHGTTTLAQIEESCDHHAAGLGLSLAFRPSNHEGEPVDLVQSARQSADAIIINPAGYSFTSIAILDAIKAFEGPAIEVHISIFTHATRITGIRGFHLPRPACGLGDLRARVLQLYRGNARTRANGEASRSPLAVLSNVAMLSGAS
jgi:3-dehydroquinate dehydratase-2